MTDPIAAGKMQIGLGRFLDRYPLIAGIVATWTITEDSTVRTMAVGFDPKNGWRLYYSPAFVKDLPVPELTGVLLHEARHVIFDHCFQTPVDYPDESALVIAQEVTVNENMPESLPKGVMLLKDYPQLPPDESTDTRYHRLAKRKSPKQKPPPATSGGGGQKGTPSDTGTDDRGKADGETRDKGEGGGGSGKPDPTKPISKPGTTMSNTGGGPAPLADDHERWSEIAANASEARDLLASSVEALREKGVRPSEYERTVIEEASRTCGDEPGKSESLLKRILEPRGVPWQVLLRRFVGKAKHRERTLKRPPRRFPKMIGVLHGRVRRGSKPTIMAVLDTSGSMSDEILAELSAELLRLTKTHKVTVVECDTEIHAVYPLNGPIESVHGRGGTSFYPPFEREFLRKIRPDLVLYLSDGFGEAPEQAPGVPVLWLLTEGAEPPAKWGKVAYLPHRLPPPE